VHKDKGHAGEVVDVRIHSALDPKHVGRGHILGSRILEQMDRGAEVVADEE